MSLKAAFAQIDPDRALLDACAGKLVSRIDVASSDILPPQSLKAIPGSSIFFDDVDTRTAAYAGIDSISDKSHVLVLGSGNGGESAAIARHAARVHGIDINDESVQFAQRNFGNQRLTFSIGDYISWDIARFKSILPASFKPDCLAANPPYVPSVDVDRVVSMHGGPDGLHFFPAVFRVAEALEVTNLALTIGSYTSPARIGTMLAEKGFQITSLTLAAIPFGEFSQRNAQQILALEKSGDAILWRRDGRGLGYIVTGISATRRPIGPYMAPTDLAKFLRTASAAKTNRLETIDVSGEVVVPIRVIISE